MAVWVTPYSGGIVKVGLLLPNYLIYWKVMSEAPQHSTMSQKSTRPIVPTTTQSSKHPSNRLFVAYSKVLRYSIQVPYIPCDYRL